MKRTVFCITILICLSSSVTFGIAPVGEPSANLFQKGWWSLGFDYSMSEIDLDFENTSDTSLLDGSTIDAFDIDLMLGKAGLGIAKNWEVFVGFGTANASGFDDESTEPWGNNPSYVQKNTFEFDDSSGMAAQVGTKYTFYEKSLIKAGVALQATWLNLSSTLEQNIYREDLLGNREPIGTDNADFDSELLIFQIAPGISYEVSFGYSIYGGPLFQWVYGKAESKGQSAISNSEFDITSDSTFGGFVGFQADIDAFISLNLEYQMTGSSSSIGLSVTSKF